MTCQLRIDPSITEKFPEYECLIIYASNFLNHPSMEYSNKILRVAEQEKREAFGSDKASSHPHIVAWRQAYKLFGAKPKKHLCSVEALLGRVLKNENLPEINSGVDIYNAVSLRHTIPIGGEDLDGLTSDLVLTIASGDEPFIFYQKGEEVIEYPHPGEVIWADSTGVTCRRWNWRQCHRTALTINTKNAYFVLDCLPPYSKEHLLVAGEELIEHLKFISPEVGITYEFLNQND